MLYTELYKMVSFCDPYICLSNATTNKL